MSEEFTIAECAAKAKVSARTIRREIADGKIRVSKVGGDASELYELERRAILKYRPKLNRL